MDWVRVAEMPKNKKLRFTIVLNSPIADAFLAACESDERGMAQMVRIILKQYLMERNLLQLTLPRMKEGSAALPFYPDDQLESKPG